MARDAHLMKMYQSRRQEGSATPKKSGTTAHYLRRKRTEEMLLCSPHRHPLTIDDCLLLHRASLVAVIIGTIALAFITICQLASIEAALAALAV
ncbi:hypothetical protein AZF01_07555 [Martelella sp. AD-3]|nr:hypothetical protein AZF01_07555 [Martelella sp. AD-3]